MNFNRVYLKYFYTILLFACARTIMAQTPIVMPAPGDSTEYYRKTKKPVFNDPTVVEYAATTRADGKQVIIQVEEKNSKYRLYESSLTAGTWSKPTPLFNSKTDTTSALYGGPSISFDGNNLYFFRDNDLFYSSRNKEGWGIPISLGAPLNTGEYETFPSISSNEKTIYFVKMNTVGAETKETRKKSAAGELFCTSIFRATRQPNGTWSKPERLPYPINMDCEKAPRIMADNKTLIFSSNRPGGLGGFDLYQSRLTDLDTWTSPEPLNFVNTAQDDLSPSISAQGNLMYYTESGKDIYSVVIPHKYRQFMNNVLQGYVTDQDTKKGLDVEIIVTDAFTSEVVMTQTSSDDGRYAVVLPTGRSFNLEFKKGGYSSYLHAMDLTKVKRYIETDLSIELFKSVKLNINVNDYEIFEPLSAEVKIRIKGQGSFFKELKTDPKTGNVTIDFPLGQDYEIIISSPGFKGFLGEFNVSGLIVYRDFEQFNELVPEKKEVMINVADLHNSSKVKSKVLIRNKDRDEVIEVSGNQMVSLRSGDRYEIEVTSDQGYAFNSQSLDLSKGAETNIEIKLQKLEVNANLELKDINFESNSAKLSNTSFVELERVLKLLTDNPTLQVEIAAHTDDIGSDIYNKSLSQKRAQSVVDFLTQNKIVSTRFRAAGYGEALPKAINNSEANRAVNRRVELKIIGI